MCVHTGYRPSYLHPYKVLALSLHCTIWHSDNFYYFSVSDIHRGKEKTERRGQREKDGGDCEDSVSFWRRPSPGPQSFVRGKPGEIEFSAALPSEETLTDTHELNANWRQQRFDCELWERGLNGTRPWTEIATLRWSWNHVCVCSQY